jgi:hypothetical protein
MPTRPFPRGSQLGDGHVAVELGDHAQDLPYRRPHRVIIADEKIRASTGTSSIPSFCRYSWSVAWTINRRENRLALSIKIMRNAVARDRGEPLAEAGATLNRLRSLHTDIVKRADGFDPVVLGVCLDRRALARPAVAIADRVTGPERCKCLTSRPSLPSSIFCIHCIEPMRVSHRPPSMASAHSTRSQ